jgi:hypothetical protein
MVLALLPTVRQSSPFTTWLFSKSRLVPDAEKPVVDLVDMERVSERGCVHTITISFGAVGRTVDQVANSECSKNVRVAWEGLKHEL